MTDYLAVCLNGIATGVGVLIAHEAWDVFKKYRERIRKEAEKIFQREES